MVQVFGPSPRSMQNAQIGQAMGQGLSKRMGLNELENLTQTNEQDPVKLAVKLAQISNYAPGMERALPQVYEAMMQKSQSNQMAEGLSNNSNLTDITKNLKGTSATENNIPPNSRNQNEIAQNGAQPNSMDTPINDSQPMVSQVILPSGKGYKPEDVNNISQQFLSTFRPDLVQGSSTYGRVPPFNFEMQSDLTKEEEGQVRQDLTNKKFSPKAIESIVNRTREDVKRAYNDKLKAYDIDLNQQGNINKKWETFKERSGEYLQPLLGKYDSMLGFGGKPRTANDLKNKYFQYAQGLPVNLTPEQMHAQAGTMLQKDINRIDALGAIPPLPFVRDPSQVEENVKDRKEAYKELLKEGYYETLKEDAINNGGMGLEELHYTLYGDQTDKNDMKMISDLKAPTPYFKAEPYKPEMKGYVPQDKINPNYTKERKAYIENLSSRLKNIKPDDDLILLRAQALNSGAQERDFNDALEMSKEKGLKLSPFQKDQEVEIRIPRKPPIWQIFNPKAWEKWINHAAGKR